jgi:hypothetical protein
MLILLDGGVEGDTFRVCASAADTPTAAMRASHGNKWFMIDPFTFFEAIDREVRALRSCIDL